MNPTDPLQPNPNLPPAQLPETNPMPPTTPQAVPAQPVFQSPVVQPVQPQPMGQMPPIAQPSMMQPMQPAPKVPFYRSYWIFAAIYIILPSIFGLVILFTGNIFRKQKDGQVLPIKKREKITLTVVSILLWAFLVFSVVNSLQASMASWYSANKNLLKTDITAVVNDMDSVQNATSPSDLADKCKQLQQDINSAKTIPAMPDKVAQGYFNDVLSDWTNIATTCIDVANNPTQANATSGEAKINQYSDKSAADIKLLNDQLTKDGFQAA